MGTSTKKLTSKLNGGAPTSKTQWERPCEIEIEVLFPEGNRKVTPADLEKAAGAAAAAARASLEGRSPAYKIAEVNVAVDYLYRQSHKEFKA
jgi:hypothetical protein